MVAEGDHKISRIDRALNRLDEMVPLLSRYRKWHNSRLWRCRCSQMCAAFIIGSGVAVLALATGTMGLWR